MSQVVSGAPGGDPQGADAASLAAIAAGDAGALAGLYDAHAPRLAALARRMLRDAREAEDLVHDVFLEVWHQAGNYDRARGTVRAWLTLRLRSRALDRLRMAALRVRAAPPSAAPTEDGTALTDRVAAAQALAALTPPQREALGLAYFEGLSSSEIAARLGQPLGTVKSRLSAALARLRTNERGTAGGGIA
jgi:RNA polymerase sigma-70 factor (ECF subfamily)